MAEHIDLLYITNDTTEAKAAVEAGVDILFVDTEIKGKIERQGHLDTVISKHQLEDIKKLVPLKKEAKILTRINPYHEDTADEIETAIAYGTDMIMLPMFTTKKEVDAFVKAVDGRVETCLLLETPQAMVRLDQILEVEGIDRIHIGLNDLHLGLGLTFMFECLSAGLVESMVEKIRAKGIQYGFGGVAKVGQGELPAELVLSEHARLGSTMAILSRAFKKENTNLKEEVQNLRQAYATYRVEKVEVLQENQEQLKAIVRRIVDMQQ